MDEKKEVMLETSEEEKAKRNEAESLKRVASAFSWKGKPRKKKIVLRIILAVAIVVGLLISYIAGASIQYADDTLQYNKLVDNYNDLNGQYNEALGEYDDAVAEYKNLEEKYDEYKHKMEPYEELEERKETLNELDSQIKDKKAEIKDKQNELDALTQKIKETSEKPITLPSGDYTVGTDIPAGRYKVSGSSNFVVRDSYGDLCINTILDTQYGDGDYVATLESGMKAHCASKTTFTPVE